MKKIIIPSLILLFAPLVVISQTFKPYPSESIEYNGYLFPVLPGSEEWKSLTHSQRIASCMMPQDTLEFISTSRLLETCLYYPYNIDAFAFDDVVAGFSRIKMQFNAYSELFQRPDLTEKLINLYSSRNPSFVTQIDELREQGRYSFDYYILELMLVQAETLAGATDGQILQIITMLLNKLDQMELLTDYYSKTDYSVLCLAVGKSLQRVTSFSNYEGNTLIDFLIDGKVRDVTDLDYIINEARKI